MAELVDAGDSKSPGFRSLRVQVSPALPDLEIMMEHSFKIKDNFKLEKKASKVITEDHFIIEKEMTYAGQHIILDLWNVQFDNKVTTLEEIIKAAIIVSKAMLLHIHLHRFGKSQGISGVALLAESHISVHTWPERNYIAFDIFMCGDTFPNLAANSLVKALKPSKKDIYILKRGKKKIEY